MPLIIKIAVLKRCLSKRSNSSAVITSCRKRMKQQVEVRDDECIGTIVNLSSLAAQRAQPELLGYSVSTAALDQMTRSLALAYADSGIRVNAVAFASLMSASLQATLKENPDMRKDIEEHTPIGWIASAMKLWTQFNIWRLTHHVSSRVRS